MVENSQVIKKPKAADLLRLSPDSSSASTRNERDRHDEFQLNHPVEFMRLTLTYEGPLHAASTNETRNPEKHAIRREFHKQLRDVWNTHLALGDSFSRVQQSLKWAVEDREKGRTGRAPSSFPITEMGGFVFVPLVCRALYSICELDILFLRREPPGGLVNQAGDIDNRIKVLFDALRVPANANEIPTNAAPADNEAPLFCLLEDDKLITSFRLDSDQLFGTAASESAAFVKLVIRATVKVQRLTFENLGLGDTI